LQPGCKDDLASQRHIRSRDICSETLY